MKYVIDCAAAFKWVVAEIDTPKAVQLWDDYRNGVIELVAPDLFPIEIGNSLLMAERRGRIASGEGAQLLADVFKALPILHASITFLPRAYEIAHRTRHTVYVCLYVALAERENCELVTADDKLIRNLHSSFPFIRALASL